MRRLFRTVTLCMSVCALISACGGGSGDGGSATVASTSAFPLAAIYAAPFKAPYMQNFDGSIVVSGVSASVSGTATGSALVSGAFEGVSASYQAIATSITVSAANQSATTRILQAAWVDANYRPLGHTVTIDGNAATTYTVVNGTANIPESVHVNDAGTIYTANVYSDSSKSNLLGTEILTYSIDPETASTAVLKLKVANTVNSTNSTTNTTTFIRITPAGEYTYLRREGVSNGVPVTFIYR